MHMGRAGRYHGTEKEVLTRMYTLLHQMSSECDKTGNFTNTNYTEITRKQNSYPLVGKAKINKTDTTNT